MLENSSASRVLLDSEYHGYAEGTNHSRDTSQAKERPTAGARLVSSTLGSHKTFGNSNRKPSRGRGNEAYGEAASISLSKHRSKLGEQQSYSMIDNYKTKHI